MPDIDLDLRVAADGMSVVGTLSMVMPAITARNVHIGQARSWIDAARRRRLLGTRALATLGETRYEILMFLQCARDSRLRASEAS